MKRRYLGVVLGVLLILTGCITIQQDTNATTAPAILGDAAFLVIDLLKSFKDDKFNVAADSILLANDAIKLFTTLPANDSPSEPPQAGHVLVVLRYNKQGVDSKDVFDVNAGKAHLGIIFEGGKTFETFSVGMINIDASQTDKITIIPIQDSVNAVTVSAGQGWQNSNIFVQRGKKFEIKYKSGVWTSNTGSVGTSDAAGQPANAPPNLLCRCGEPVPGFSTQALIGQIGDGRNNAPLQVGDDFSGVAYANDFLNFRMNLPDSLLSKSSGSIVVYVYTYNAD